jgi:hypothetical protein
MAFCRDCELLGQELAEAYPPDTLKFHGSRQLRQSQNGKPCGVREVYKCRACGARWARESGPTAKYSTWTKCAARAGNIAAT